MKIKLLDRGYVELCDSWGSDQAIIEAARQSTDKGFIGWGPQHTEQCGIRHTWFKCDCKPKPGDEKLLAYLWDNKHSTPFEFAGISIEVQAPLAVFAEWHRHRTQGYSQHSTRYSPLPSLHYLPTVERCMVKASGNKQAGAMTGADELTEEAAIAWLSKLAALYEHSEEVYSLGLKAGIPKEVARYAITVARYSKMRATGNLRNWLSFVLLRSAPDAQYEIRVYSDAVLGLLGQKFPRTVEIFNRAQS